MRHNPWPRALLLLALMVSGTLSPAQGSPRVSTDHATVTLMAASARPAPGDTLWLGLHFRLIPHWHIYWRNPGASGTAPVIRWDLPAGWQAGDIHWPVPHRLAFGPLTNYGYEDTVTLMVPVHIPPEGPLPADMGIGAEAEWLVCREECIPERGRFTLNLRDADPRQAREAFASARAHWPLNTGAGGSYGAEEGALAINLSLPDAAGPLADVWFAAHQWGPVDASGPQSWQATADGVTLLVPPGDMPPTGDGPLEGLVVVEAAGDGGRRGYTVALAPAAPTMPAGPATAGLMAALGLAFVGGIILNIMPCVLPVLGIKVLGFVQEAGARRRRLAAHGLLYTLGILASFGLLAAVLLGLRAGGESLGWGFQLQSPLVVALLAYLMMLVGLNLSGVYALGGRLMGLGQTMAGGGGLTNTFATGVLAAVVASPCTAPFMAAALGFAVTRPAPEALTVFLALGAGFALPVLLLGLWPAWVRLIPRPGPWMERFRQALAFPMYATAAWLLWVLSQQTDVQGYGLALAGLVALAMAAWAYGQWQPRGWRMGLLGGATATALAFALGAVSSAEGPAPRAALAGQQPWSPERVRELAADGRPVFVNFTAAWCITCKVNEQVALATADTHRLFESHGVAYLVADWTRRDPAITRQLEHFGRNGVPLYLLYGPHAETPRVLPQILTEGLVAEAVGKL